ncbi:MAG: RDD family protein [Candidatus Dormibacteraeota bacterium]|nr:RDD family protein [Candidatus Dormibacteraeota bacterium]
MPIGAKICDICGPLGPAPVAWTAPTDVAPVQFVSTAAAWTAGTPPTMAASDAPKAGFWARVLAYFIDGVIIGLPTYALGTVVLHASLAGREGISLLIQISYFVYFWSSYGKGQTIAMQMLHMKVVRTDGSTLSVGSALVRYVGLIVASFPLGLGLIWVGIDARKQGWHDKMADTYVLSNWS